MLPERSKETVKAFLDALFGCASYPEIWGMTTEKIDEPIAVGWRVAP
jgi:hypothetical protein